MDKFEQALENVWERSRPIMFALFVLTLALQAFAPSAEAKVIYVVNHHTGEQAKVDLDTAAGLSKFDLIAKDWRQDEVCAIDIKTINWLVAILDALPSDRMHTVRIVSGYRTPKTNALVGGASKSKHLTCQALDFKVDGVTTKQLYHVARKTQAGGLGVYLHLGFIHIDSGRVRRW